MRKPNSLNAVLSLVAELLFVLLPLLVQGLVLTLYKHEPVAALARGPEWSFAAAILFGQSLVRFVAGVTKLQRTVWERLSAAVAGIIVLGLMPSLIVLSLVLISPTPTTGLVVVQFALFAMAVAVFLMMGGIGHYAMSEENRRGSGE